MILTGEPFVVRDVVQVRNDIMASCTEGNKVQVWHHNPESKQLAELHAQTQLLFELE